MSKFLKFIVNIFLICAILIAAAILIPPLAGIQTTIVDTASMDTNLPLGSITYSTDVDASEIQAGDEVLKDSNTSTYAYIVKSVDRDTDTFTVVNAMDQNADTEEITLRNSVPKVAVVVPYIGYVIIAMHSTEGIIIIALVVVLIIILFILSELWKEKPEDEEEEDDEEQKTYSFLDQEESDAAGEPEVTAGADSAEPADDGAPRETDGSGLSEDDTDRNAGADAAKTDAPEEEQTAAAFEETYVSSSETGEQEDGTVPEDAAPATDNVNFEAENGSADGRDESAGTGSFDEQEKNTPDGAEPEAETARTASANDGKTDDGPDIPEYITNWSSGKKTAKKQKETADAAPVKNGSAEEPQTAAAAEADDEENAEPVKTVSEEDAEASLGDTRTFPTIRRNGSGRAGETENRDEAYDLSDAIEQATQEAEKQAEEDAAKKEAQRDTGGQAAESADAQTDPYAEPEPQEKPEEEEEQEQFVPVEHATLDELLDQAKKAGDEPDVSRDDATGITVVDYSGVL